MNHLEVIKEGVWVSAIQILMIPLYLLLFTACYAKEYGAHGVGFGQGAGALKLA